MSITWLIVLLVAKFGFGLELDIMFWLLLIPLCVGDDIAGDKIDKDKCYTKP